MKLKKQYKIELAPTLAGHWYSVHKQIPDRKTKALVKKELAAFSVENVEAYKEKFLGYFPSSTTILEAYPLSKFLVDWKVQQGATEADRILKEAGARGTNVHDGIEHLLGGGELMKSGYSLDEWNRLNSFKAWFDKYKPKVLETEFRVFSEKYGYCGTFDVLAKINGVVSLGDWKTSSNIYPHFWLQLASYAEALEEMSNVKVEQTFICQFGSKNKDGYRYVINDVPWQDHFQTFLSVKNTFEYDKGIDKDFEPPILNLPETLRLS